MFKDRKLLCIIVSVLLAMSLTLVGCGGTGKTGTTVTPGVLTVGSDCDYPPFIEMNGEKPRGFEYDLLKAIADELGLELVYLPPQNFDSIITSVVNRTMDVGVSSFTITDDRKKLVNFTIPYYDSNQAVVTMRNAPYTRAKDLSGLTVGAQSGTTGAAWVRENLGPKTTLKEYNAASELMAALNAGDIQGAFLDEPVAVEYVATNYTGSHVLESIPTGEQYGIVVSKDNPDLLRSINEAMKTLKVNGTFDKIFQRYFPNLTPPSLGV